MIGETESRFQHLEERNKESLRASGFVDSQMTHYRYLGLRYTGTDTSLMVERGNAVELRTAYAAAFKT
jgi:N-methylhydantoinase A/oxoprolinase/acetone carboxylase beta subunit